MKKLIFEVKTQDYAYDNPFVENKWSSRIKFIPTEIEVDECEPKRSMQTRPRLSKSTDD